MEAVRLVTELAAGNILETREVRGEPDLEIEQQQQMTAVAAVESLLEKSRPFWIENTKDHDPGLECGDDLLVAVRIVAHVPYKSDYWQFFVITVTENGFEDPNGLSWLEFAWSGVSYYHVLKQADAPPYKETL